MSISPSPNYGGTVIFSSSFLTVPLVCIILISYLFFLADNILALHKKDEPPEN